MPTRCRFKTMDSFSFFVDHKLITDAHFSHECFCIPVQHIYAFGSFGTSMNFKPLPDTDISASLRFSFAKFMMNFLFILARSFNFLDVCDCLRVLDFKWHDRDLILSFTCRLIHFFYGIFYFFAILELCISFVTLINWYKAIWRHTVCHFSF